MSNAVWTRPVAGGGLSKAWRWAALMIAAAVVCPVLVVFAAWALPAPPDIWAHLRETTLARVALNTVILLVGVVSLSAVLGVSLAWLTALTEFPGRRFLSWALLAPMAMPTYVLGFVYCGLLDFASPMQRALRAWFGDDFHGIPPIRSPLGVVLVMSLALYPYVYMISRAAFLTQGAKALETGRSLGCAPRSAFLRLAIPLARPWILGALTLVAMEALSDFGTVSIFSFETFTTAIYKAWHGFFSPVVGAQLASLLAGVIFAVIYAQQAFERRKIYTGMGSYTAHLTRLRLSVRQRIGVMIFAWTIFALSFALPVAQLLIWAIHAAITSDIRLGEHILNSFILGALTALVATAAALVLTITQRYFRDRGTQIAGRIVLLGYALPGSILAVGVFLPLIWLDRQLADLIERLFDADFGLLLTGTVFAMVLGLSARFLAVAYTSLSNGAHRISKRLDEAATVSGVVGNAAVRKLHLPLLRKAMLTGAVLVFVDVIKEMPLTLMTRPFGWDTLSVRVFELTNEGEWQKAALPAVLLLLTGLIPVAWMSLAQEGATTRKGSGS